MAYKSKTGLNPISTIKNGQEAIEFIEFSSRYQDTYIQYITEYYNPITGLYDSTKTLIYFEGNDTLLINQDYATTVSELT
ncbi:MAG: hypothetical protein H8E16_15025 [Flavobacteriales bacterium]|nr:hypothetical protein [Flavobacteriales bacterium]